MNLVLDTHIFLWLCFEPSKIPTAHLATMKERKNKLLVTSLTFWEISLKFSLGKLQLSGVTPEDLLASCPKMSIDVIDINKQSMASSYKLEKIKGHKDPFDRAIIWYCICNNLHLISADTKFSPYEKLGLKLI